MDLLTETLKISQETSQRHKNYYNPRVRFVLNPMSNISSSWQNTKLHCQICDKISHFAIKCWHRYDY